ncbi:MAG: hypothetical protein HZA46_17195 [Planctomycetales bacterium]|nr:hypothetical protein [Planctomycetales bacterium]
MLLSPLTVASITTTSAAGRDHLDELALEVQRKANELCWEMYLYHRHQPDFRETYKAAREIWSLAGHIHELLHRDPAPLGHVVKDMLELDQLFQLIENDMAAWNDARIDMNLRSSPMRLMRRGGNVKTLHAKLRALEEAIRYLDDDSNLTSEAKSSEMSGREPMIE